ncbi:MAG TPA: glycosyltransferase family 2 protein [Miltoncostaeaceae bacterium]|nr:glycosyltransferase family 2 protein [Miltoncostaeaceae bacterium]
MPDTVVFIPAFNEEANLPAVLEELRSGLPAVDVLVIDDGSTDATADVARSYGADVVSFGENRGLRIGIATGYREAMERGYAICGRVDADGQHPVAELARLIALVRADACDVAVGSRFAAGEGYEADRYAPSPSRRFGIGLLQGAMRLRLGRRFMDATSGMAAVNAAAMPIMAHRPRSPSGSQPEARAPRPPPMISSGASTPPEVPEPSAMAQMTAFTSIRLAAGPAVMSPRSSEWMAG